MFYPMKYLSLNRVFRPGCSGLLFIILFGLKLDHDL